MTQGADQGQRRSTVGVGQAVGAYGWWGCVTPVYFKLLAHVGALELVALRVLTGVPILAVLVWRRGSLDACRAALSRSTTRWALAASTLLIATNWFVFILSVQWDRLTESSLGYYINPLVSVLLGYVVLRERLRPLQWVAVSTAFGGVALMAIQQGSLPWISLTLACSFGLYGLLRKQMAIGSVEGLAIEMTALIPVAVAAQAYMFLQGRSVLSAAGPGLWGLLLLGGIFTIIPLVLFAAGARRLKLATMGLLQYIAPSGQLILAVLVYGEPFSAGTAVVFGLIWVAVILYSLDALRSRSGRNG